MFYNIFMLLKHHAFDSNRGYLAGHVGYPLAVLADASTRCGGWGCGGFRHTALGQGLAGLGFDCLHGVSDSLTGLQGTRAWLGQGKVN